MFRIGHPILRATNLAWKHSMAAMAMDTIKISLDCMQPGSMRQREPRQAAVDKEAWKRKHLDSKALAENTLMLATRNPIMLLRVRQKEHQQKPARRRHCSSIFSRAKEYQPMMKALKIFDEMMQGANAWRASLDADVAAVGVMESESDIAYTDSSQSSVAV
jgi:hypothetical protein